MANAITSFTLAIYIGWVRTDRLVPDSSPGALGVVSAPHGLAGLLAAGQRVATHVTPLALATL